MYFVNKTYYYAYMAITKQFFGLLINSITEWFSPTLLRISGDSSLRGQLNLDGRGHVATSFPDRLIMISNHQARQVESLPTCHQRTC